MKIDVGILGKQQVASTSGTKKMKLSEHAQSMVFQLFTKNVYSNPIGTVVREITSNCFDSHQEAGVNHPVLIKKTYDEQTETTFISFVDYGVGMSPDRVENVYGVYFESTKRLNNNEIGGFGIGGKTPLAYKRYTGDGEGEYDNSFFVITNYDGIKYYYNVFEGQEAPEWSLIHQEETEERNGTEIRIPVLQKDINKFEQELKRQLFYFENIIFEGFSDHVENDYTIVKGNNFLYRGDSLDSSMHVCLGRVYYPIDYNVLGLNIYEHSIPVAINVPIGSINVTVSRESLDYSEATIAYLRKRLEEAKKELVEMLSFQYNNVTTLEDYFMVKNDFGTLRFEGNKMISLKNVVKKKEINYSNFIYDDIDVPESGVLFDLFFRTNIYGEREKKSYFGQDKDNARMLKKSYTGIVRSTNMYYANRPDVSRKRITQGYLKEVNKGRFYLITKRPLSDQLSRIESEFRVHYDSYDNYINSDLYKTLMQMQDDYFKIVQKYGQNYENVEIPDTYVETHKEKNKLSKEILKKTIPIRIYGSWGKKRVKISELVNFKGIIFYGETYDETECGNCYHLFTELFDEKYVAQRYYTYDNKFSGSGNHVGIMFISMAKSNLKYVKYFKKAYHINQFYNKIARRKVDLFIKKYRNEDIIDKFDGLSDFYKSELFSKVSKYWANKVKEVDNHIRSIGDHKIPSHRLLTFKNYFGRYVDLSKIKLGSKEEKIVKIVDEFRELDEINSDVFSYIRVPSKYNSVVSEEKDEKFLTKILKDLLTL